MRAQVMLRRATRHFRTVSCRSEGKKYSPFSQGAFSDPHPGATKSVLEERFYGDNVKGPAPGPKTEKEMQRLGYMAVAGIIAGFIGIKLTLGKYVEEKDKAARESQEASTDGSIRV
eukprot:m.73614 g.73614  ORF g.73614 m.73614 type:complete len:116 (-) comp12426_c0_seq4:1435-1782(-)